jgi:UDP-N-acetylmuramyl tripeptide synthase
MSTPEPHYGFHQSRRLTGPNRYFGATAVTLTPLGEAAHDAVALESWRQHVLDMAQRLGWPHPEPLIERHARDVALIFSAPEHALLTATEVSEWAWEMAAAAAGERGFDLAHLPLDQPVTVFAARAALERSAALEALRAAATAHNLPLFVDDDAVSIGAGSGSHTWARAALPEVGSIDWAALHDVPTALVTGSNGKTTTVRLLAAIAAASGFTPGLCCTEGVYVGGQAVTQGDYSGPDGARVVLRHSGVEAAILETARGGILRRGLAVRRAGAAVVTNIRADHFGEYGIDTAEALAETKLVVAHALSGGGLLVLNADDAVLMAAAARLPHVVGARWALFAQAIDSPALSDWRARGGMTCAVRDGNLVLHEGGRDHSLGALSKMPLTFEGAALYNVGNLSAAALAAVGLGLPLSAVLTTLESFGASPLDNPGRLERWRHHGAVVLVDYAHNPDALDQLLTTARALQPARLSVLLGQAGNRGDDAIADLASTAAGQRVGRCVGAARARAHGRGRAGRANRNRCRRGGRCAAPTRGRALRRRGGAAGAYPRGARPTEGVARVVTARAGARDAAGSGRQRSDRNLRAEACANHERDQ